MYFAFNNRDVALINDSIISYKNKKYFFHDNTLTGPDGLIILGVPDLGTALGLIFSGKKGTGS